MAKLRKTRVAQVVLCRSTRVSAWFTSSWTSPVAPFNNMFFGDFAAWARRKPRRRERVWCTTSVPAGVSRRGRAIAGLNATARRRLGHRKRRFRRGAPRQGHRRPPRIANALEEKDEKFTGKLPVRRRGRREAGIEAYARGGMTRRMRRVRGLVLGPAHAGACGPGVCVPSKFASNQGLEGGLACAGVGRGDDGREGAPMPPERGSREGVG